jgi:putative methyltransferase (TIGR04325 family)
VVPANICDTYDQARVLSGEGYDDERLAAIVARKTSIALAADQDLTWLTGAPLFLGLAVVRSANPNQPVRMIDYGGACGFHVRIAKRRLPDIPVRFAVVETAAMATASTVFSDPDVRILTSIDAAMAWLGGVDLVHCSSSIEYVPNPDATLRSLSALHAPFMLFQRLHLACTERFIVVQSSRLAENGPGPLPPGMADAEIKYPCTYVTEAEFVKGCAGYDVQFKIPSTQHQRIEGQDTIFGDVFLLRRRCKI